MIYGFELRKLRIIGNDEKASEVSFKSGLNVIAGPSNTGKTYIFECINFMLGGTELPEPIDEAKEYHTVQLEIISRNNQVYTLERGLTGGKVKKYNSAISEIESNSKFTELAQKHAKKESVSSFLMKLSGFINTELFVIDRLSNQVRQFLCERFVSGSPAQAFSGSVVNQIQ
ncbi:AAA family ATPase [Paenibacillus xylanilyticus]|uniref:AAA family ATPase n=1 Tax=Paenibacillus xylanilyticus TaxID=248903 RepID=A0A7Y6BUI5_9BACL|nr:AAA family ATPase [Paenibacillus xylanilyticus]NUU75240.1 AAA family ATPase [Paenibacillus xylanilyticus]